MADGNPAAALVVVLVGLDFDRITLHPLLPLLTRYFRGLHNNLRVVRLPALADQLDEADQFVAREVGFLAPLYVAGGLPLSPWGTGPATA